MLVLVWVLVHVIERVLQVGNLGEDIARVAEGLGLEIEEDVFADGIWIPHHVVDQARSHKKNIA